ncbi:MAG: GWxTD domain-containing protein [Ignavibacteriales bacterium]|nr:GWxTD domain-containing protein [Ignavibacteriales bacterium]
MKKLLHVFLLLLAVSSVTVKAQQLKLGLDVDFACFSEVDSVMQVELYYHLLISKDISIKDASFSGDLKIEFFSPNDSSKNKEYVYQISKINIDDSTYGRSLVGVFTYYLKPGEYIIIASAEDSLKKAHPVTIDFKMQLQRYPKGTFSISDIELANSISKSENTDSRFYKNTFEIIPNPTRVFNQNMPVAFYYCELFGLKENAKQSQLRLDINLFNANNERVYKKSKIIGRTENNIVEVGSLNIMKYPTGTYTLALALIDSVDKRTYLKQKKFFIYTQTAADTSFSLKGENEYMASEFAVLSEEDLTEAFNQAKYIASTQEIDKWNRLSTIESKRVFIYEFWKKRDNAPETPDNEFRKEFYERVRYVNDKFSSFKKKGWFSDRGRVYIMHGEPSEIERFPNETDYKPYEVWHYNGLEGGAIFVFADLNGYQDYQLIHSTLRGELRDDYWTRRVKTN